MIRLRSLPDLKPEFMTRNSAGADLRARTAALVEPGQVAKVPTGVWIESVDWDNVPKGAVPEVQIRARSSLAFKHSVCLANGIGTVDADYPDEICVLLINHGPANFVVNPGDRIAQLVVALAYQIPDCVQASVRRGGFGSTSL